MRTTSPANLRRTGRGVECLSGMARVLPTRGLSAGQQDSTLILACLILQELAVLGLFNVSVLSFRSFNRGFIAPQSSRLRFWLIRR